MGKKVLIITGSPRLKGNTNALATAFASGAVAAGNEVEVFDAATANLNGCHADKSCEQRGCCGQKDDGVRMNELMREADVLVLASPVYWSGFTSQIKTAIDRFYQFSFPKGRETLHIKDLYLIAASANPDSAMFNDVVHAYEQLCELLHFDKGGTLLCPGLAGADDLENHQEFLEKAGGTSAVISCGAGNSYGHPHSELLDRLKRAGYKILRTDQDGMIRFKVKK